MKIFRILFLSVTLVAVGVSCTPDNQALMKKQSGAARDVGEAYLNQRNYTAALREFKKAEELYPDDPFLQYDMGLVYMAKERYTEAVNRFQKALDLNPSYTPARNSLGAAYLAQKDYDAAIENFKKAVEDDLYATPYYPLALMGRAYYEQKQYTLAEQYFRQALDKRPNYIYALTWLGRTLNVLGRGREAAGVLEKSLRFYPDWAETHLELAKSHILLREFAKARDEFRRTIQLAPDSDMARTAKEALERLGY